MTIQTLILGVITPVFFGAIFHIWRGGPAWRLAMYIALAMAGFWIGHLIATQLGWKFLSVGALEMGAGILGSFIFLGLGFWLSYKQPEEDTKGKKYNTRGRRI